ncbi:RDD family protein, partial [Kitasatospora nipponensis]|uniref:RDD family protein n=1 Tax=Kitasatospora nipponensis TaxID=258049 RepID=UPI0031E468DC
MPASASAAGSDPARPPLGRRGLAWLIDFALVVALAVLLGFLTVHRLGALLTDVPGLAGRGGWDLLTSHGNLVAAGRDVGAHLWHSAVLDVQEGFGALVLCAFGYHFAAVAFRGRTLGKAALALRVAERATGPGRTAGAGWAPEDAGA